MREVEEEARPFNEAGPLQVTLCVSRPDDFHIPYGIEDDEPMFTHSIWEKFPFAMVIFGGGYIGFFVNSMKRKFNELIDAALIWGKSEPITLYLKELHGGAPNSKILLLVRSKLANFGVHHILVD